MNRPSRITEIGSGRLPKGALPQEPASPTYGKYPDPLFKKGLQVRFPIPQPLTSPLSNAKQGDSNTGPMPSVKTKLFV